MVNDDTALEAWLSCSVMGSEVGEEVLETEGVLPLDVDWVGRGCK